MEAQPRHRRTETRGGRAGRRVDRHDRRHCMAVTGQAHGHERIQGPGLGDRTRQGLVAEPGLQSRPCHGDRLPHARRGRHVRPAADPPPRGRRPYRTHVRPAWAGRRQSSVAADHPEGRIHVRRVRRQGAHVRRCRVPRPCRTGRRPRCGRPARRRVRPVRMRPRLERPWTTGRQRIGCGDPTDHAPGRGHRVDRGHTHRGPGSQRIPARQHHSARRTAARRPRRAGTDHARSAERRRPGRMAARTLPVHARLGCWACVHARRRAHARREPGPAGRPARRGAAPGVGRRLDRHAPGRALDSAMRRLRVHGRHVRRGRVHAYAGGRRQPPGRLHGADRPVEGGAFRGQGHRRRRGAPFRHLRTQPVPTARSVPEQPAGARHPRTGGRHTRHRPGRHHGGGRSDARHPRRVERVAGRTSGRDRTAGRQIQPHIQLHPAPAGGRLIHQHTGHRRRHRTAHPPEERRRPRPARRRGHTHRACGRRRQNVRGLRACARSQTAGAGEQTHDRGAQPSDGPMGGRLHAPVSDGTHPGHGQSRHIQLPGRPTFLGARGHRRLGRGHRAREPVQPAACQPHTP